MMFRGFFLLLLTAFISNRSFAQQLIYTVAGSGGYTYSGDGIAATAANLPSPRGVTVDLAGNMYIAEADHRIRKVNTAGIISTVAGNGIAGNSGDGGPATAAEIDFGMFLAVDRAGNLYISDGNNNNVRKVDAAGMITTVAGDGGSGFGGDGGPATNAKLYQPQGIAIDKLGNLYIADDQNERVRKVNTAGIISTVAGTGVAGYNGDGIAATTAELNHPLGITLDTAGNLYIADFVNYRIRKVTPAGVISTIAGKGISGYSGDGGPATAAAFTFPEGIAADTMGNIFFSDNFKNNIRKVDAAGIITTYAGGPPYLLSDGSLAIEASFFEPAQVAVDGIGNLYIADASENRIREIRCPIGDLSGPGAVCIGGTITLSDTSAGGIWNSGASAVATVSLGTITGVSHGTATITYTLYNTCGIAEAKKIIAVDTLPMAGGITGAANVCPGDSVTLTDAAAGGVWTLTNGSASISAGIVKGIYAGIDTVIYTVTNTCGTATSVKTITIDPLPNAGAITGPGTACAGMAVTLTDTAAGGLWSSGATSIARVDPSGVVTGITAGMANISYSVTNVCGTRSVSLPVSVLALPTAGVISGTDSVCPGDNVMLSTSIAGGAWYSTNTSLASVAGGTVTGITYGMDTILYMVSNACGADTASIAFLVSAPSSCATAVNDDIRQAQASLVVSPNPNNGYFDIEINAEETRAGFITIMNMLGVPVYTRHVMTKQGVNTYSFAGLAPGFYLLSCQSAQSKEVVKIIVR